MIVFPAIDLKGGEVVRLAEGDMNRATVYADDPAAQAMLFAEQGAQFLHVVDLDGAFAGRPENAEAVEELLKISPAISNWAAAFAMHRRLNAGSTWALRGW